MSQTPSPGSLGLHAAWNRIACHLAAWASPGGGEMQPGPSEARCGRTALPRGLGGGSARGGQGRPAGGSGSRPVRGAGGFGLLVCKVGPAGGGAGGRKAHRVSHGAGPTAATLHMCRGFAILGRGSVRQALDLPSGQESTRAERRPPFRLLPPRWPCDGFTEAGPASRRLNQGPGGRDENADQASNPQLPTQAQTPCARLAAPAPPPHPRLPLL